MSSPQAIINLIISGARITGRALAAASRQAAANATYKPEGSTSSPSNGKGKASADMMSLDEARLVLNVKKDDPMEVVLKRYETIFAANSPPPPPAKPDLKSPQPTAASARKAKAAITHSHYLQSKVYRALERIKAESGEVGGAVSPQGAEGEAVAKEGESRTETKETK